MVTLDTPIQFVRGVGPVRSRHFESMGIRTVGDLVEHYPFRYHTLPKSVAIGDLQLDETATVIGTVMNVRGSNRAQHGRRFSNGRPSVVCRVVDGTGWCRVKWFNAPHVTDAIAPGDVIRLTGKVGVFGDQAEFVNPKFEYVDENDPFASDEDRFEPIYPACAELESKTIARIIRQTLPSVAPSISEPLPEQLRSARKLPPRRIAIERMHAPIKHDDAAAARQRLAYEELLLLQLAVALVRRHHASRFCAHSMPVNSTLDDRIRRRLPFTLTPGQERAVEEISADMARAHPMNRLLQGDVGSGKTAVAIYAALACIAHRRQVAILAPTEILADQHHRKVSRYLTGSRVRVALATGSMRKAERNHLLQKTRDGQIDLVVGTHALIEKDVAFGDLGLIVVDEQHRFGVAQRATLRQKGVGPTMDGRRKLAPHCLIMSATPIPRTLAMTFFGDLDVTTIRDRPPSRSSVTTQMIRSVDMESTWETIRQRLNRGEQGYVVYPLVDESEVMELKAVVTEYERLRSGPLRGFVLGMLHGRMEAAQKCAVMDEFQNGRIQVLVSTTVVEVGVDVANATVMLIEHAERYGLSQLHQLRGRVGRGSRPGLCFLVTDSRSPIAAQRLQALCSTDDGFSLAEQDLLLRGPGELLGKRQHGLPQFKAADLISDAALLEAARDDAARIVAGDPRLALQEHVSLREAIGRKYSDVAAFVSVA